MSPAPCPPTPSSPRTDGDSPKPLRPAVKADANPNLVATAKFIRRLLPGDGSRDGDSLTTSGQLRRRLSSQLSTEEQERPSAMRELGLGALQAWDALSEAQRRRRGAVDVAILFTDLVGFSSWALKAGDEPTIELLNQVGACEGDAISEHGGVVVKRLGDGSMAVFDEPAAAVRAAHAAQRRCAEIEVDGYTPKLRAGVHLGKPRKVGGDYLGVDVNVAARVGEAAKGDQVLISGDAADGLDEAEFKLGRSKRLRAEGAPDELYVCSVKPRGLSRGALRRARGAEPQRAPVAHAARAGARCATWRPRSRGSRPSRTPARPRAARAGGARRDRRRAAPRLGDPHAPGAHPPPPRPHQENALLAHDPHAEPPALDHQPRLAPRARARRGRRGRPSSPSATRCASGSPSGALSALRSLPIGTTERAPRRA